MCCVHTFIPIPCDPCACTGRSCAPSPLLKTRTGMKRLQASLEYEQLLLPNAPKHTAVVLPLLCCCLNVQIELYSHVGAIRSLVDWLKSEGWSVAAVFCMDVAFVNEPSKYIAGAMQVVMLCLAYMGPSVCLYQSVCVSDSSVVGPLSSLPHPVLPYAVPCCAVCVRRCRRW
jgi:hypothetical protein